MIEEALANYGVLGIWTLTLLADKWYSQKSMKKVIEANTSALIRVHDCLERRKK